MSEYTEVERPFLDLLAQQLRAMSLRGIAMAVQATTQSFDGKSLLTGRQLNLWIWQQDLLSNR